MSSETEALLNEIVEMIESDEQHREREIEAGRSDIYLRARKRHDETLKEKIRLRLTADVLRTTRNFANCHPELRAGEVA